MRRKLVRHTSWDRVAALLAATCALGYGTPAFSQDEPASAETTPDEPPAVESAADAGEAPPGEQRGQPRPEEESPTREPEEASPPSDKEESGEQAPPETDAEMASDESGEESDTAGAESAPAKAEEADPYAGLDHSGTPPPPPENTEELPEGKWDKNYDGRRKKRRAEDALIWIPRAPLYPVHLVLNYGVRWPIVTTVTKAEEVRFFHRVENLFTFADGQAGLYPIGFYDVGRGIWGGAHFFYNDLGLEGHSVRATAGIGSNNWLLVTATDAWTVFDDDSGTLSFTGTYAHDPTFGFSGVGPSTDIDDQVFFTEQKIEGRADLDVALDGLSRFSAGLGYRHARLQDDGRNPSFADSEFAAIQDELTGFNDWFDLITASLRLELDSRDPERQYSPGSGVRLESWVNYNAGLDAPELSFFKYGARPGVLWDITGANHVLSFSVHAEALSETGGEPPPLNELVNLGGSHMMKGFLPGRFRGESALVYSAAYQWPVLAFADALLFSDLGTTYFGFYDDFSHDKMVLDWGAGLRTSFSRDLRLEILLAWGSNQMELWDEDFDVDNVRFIAGVGRGF